MAENIVHWFNQEKNSVVIDNLLKYVTIEEFLMKDAGSLPLTGKSVVVTGTLPTLSRDAAKDHIRALGGKVGSSVSKNTDILLAGEKAGSKLQKAQELGVTIWSEQDVLNLLNH